MEIILQIVFNSIVSGLVLSLMVIGFNYIFNVTKVFHLAHAGIFTLGSFAFWKFTDLGLHWLLASILAMSISSLIILLIEKAIYLPMIRKNTDPSVTLIASMGLYVIIVNLIAMFFGSDNKIVSSSVNILEVNGIIISTNQIIQLLVGTFVVVVFYFGIKLTKLDISLKAIADNDILGEIYGVNSKRVRSLIMIIGSIIAVIAGILTTIEIGIEPHSGMNVTLTAATVAILVTRLDVKYLILVSILLTLFQNTIEWFLNSQWKEGLTFLILLMVILYKTEGLVSYKLRKN